MALTDTVIKSSKAFDKAYKLADGGGLFLLVATSGGKLWRLKYRFQGVEKLLALGAYPEVSLKQARERRDEAKKQLAEGVDPNADKKRKAIMATLAAADTFKSVADEYVDKKHREGLSGATLIKLRWFALQLENNLEKRAFSDIMPFEILITLKAIEKRGNYETAKRVRAFAARVFRYAIVTGRAQSNPASELGEALIVGKVKHHAAILEPKAVGALIRTIDTYDGNVLTLLALKLIAHVFVRPGELRHAEWSEFDFENNVWRIPAAKMKMREDHAVPLSRQALGILADAKRISGNSKYVFPSLISSLRPMSENTVNGALRRMGFRNDEMTAHGFRSTASTLLNECGKWSSDAIERALAHKDGNAIRGIYHRGSHWDERVKMAQWWSDHLDLLRDGAEVLPFRREAQ